MDAKRYQVFVSSTFADLQEERAAIVSALLQSEAIPSGMELFPAADENAWTLIQKVIDDCDYYLLVIGGRYGSVDPESDLSYTEKEFDYAVAQKKPVMAFLHKEPDEIPMGKSEKDDNLRKKLASFRAKVERTKHVKYWLTGDELAGQVALSFNYFRQNYPAVGWIRGDAQASTEAISEINELRKQLERAQQSLESARTEAPAGSEEFSQGQESAAVSPTISVAVHTEKQENPWQSKTYRGPLGEEISWDQLFDCVGPTLFDEASEVAMLRRINEWLTDEFQGVAVEMTETAAEADEDPVESVKSVDISMSRADFGTLIVQFRALGLIQKSERNRSVNDKGTYWSLTPFGEEHLTNLRAIRRDLSQNGDQGDRTRTPPTTDPPPEDDDIPF